MDVRRAIDEIKGLIAEKQELASIVDRCEKVLREQDPESFDWDERFKRVSQIEAVRDVKIPELRDRIIVEATVAFKEAWRLWERTANLPDDTPEEKASNDALVDRVMDQGIWLSSLLRSYVSAEEYRRLWDEFVRPAFREEKAEEAFEAVTETIWIEEEGAEAVGGVR